MAKIIPFAAYRPAKGLEKEIAALPYDVYSREEAKKVVESNPRSFLRIDRAETNFTDDVNTYAPEVYDKAKELMDDSIRKGDFVQDAKRCFYIYEQTLDGRSQAGIVACASIDDYLHNIIKKHENTRIEKEEDRISHVDTVGAQTGPIFLCYRNDPRIDAVTKKITAQPPVNDFVSAGEVRNRVWVIDDEADIRAIRDAFSEIDSIYIADGHHRCASAVKVGLKRRYQHPDYTGDEEFNYFLSVLFPQSELMIMAYNRVIMDLGGRSGEEFLSELARSFTVTKEGKKQVLPASKGQFGLYMDGTWYRLELLPKYRSDDPVDGLDVSVLQNLVFEPLLGITDPREDPRIDFVGGIRGAGELERRVDGGAAAAFSLYPTSLDELFAVADAGKLMPPKSTWFEPKLLSGLFIHEIDS